MAVAAGVPSVRMVHGPDPSPAAMAGAALVVFNADWSARAHPVSGPSIVVRPPVHADRYRTVPGDRVTLVNLSESKGVRTAWKVAERLPDTRFLGVVGHYGEQIRPRCRNWETISTQHDMRTVYGRTRILLMPSAVESWGRTGVEAMCSGIPVIAHPTPGLCESLGSAGVFVDRDDIDGWVAAIRDLSDPEVWAWRSAAARERAAQLDPAADIALFIESITALTTNGAPQCAQLS
jgi:glycosyltransferase involved in cell wall biosynthesis